MLAHNEAHVWRGLEGLMKSFCPCAVTHWTGSNQYNSMFINLWLFVNGVHCMRVVTLGGVTDCHSLMQVLTLYTL